MSTDEEFIYRTTDPAVLALHDKWLKEDAAYKKKVRAFKRKHPVKGSDGKVLPLLVTRSNGERVVGYEFYGSEAPEGWKIERRTSTLSPKRGTKIGKAIAADMDACRLRNLRSDLREHGMRTFLTGMSAGLGGFAMMSPGVEFLDGACWVVWSCELKADPKQGYDPAIWQPVKRSEFYAAKEAAA